MNAKKVAIGAGLAAADMFVARSPGPKFHGHCKARVCGRQVRRRP